MRTFKNTRCKIFLSWWKISWRAKSVLFPSDFESTVDESDLTTLRSNGEWSDEDLDATTSAIPTDWSKIFPVVETTEDAPETTSNEAYDDTTENQSAEVVTIDDESGEYDIDDGGKIYPPPSLQSKKFSFLSSV